MPPEGECRAGYGRLGGRGALLLHDLHQHAAQRIGARIVHTHRNDDIFGPDGLVVEGAIGATIDGQLGAAEGRPGEQAGGFLKGENIGIRCTGRPAFDAAAILANDAEAPALNLNWLSSRAWRRDRT